MPAKIAIIGAGIAGLSAGCYARMNGFETEIFESHAHAGGLCTSWKRKGYTFDGCIHWLTGSSPADSFWKLWQELGAVQDKTMIDHEVFQRYTDTDGRTFIVYSNIDRLEAHMKELSPADKDAIELLCKMSRKFISFNFPQTKAYELFNMADNIRMIAKFLPFMKYYNYCNKTTLGQFALKFKDPLLRESIPRIFGGENMSMVALVITLALMHKKAGGFPLGGSLEFAHSIEKRYTELGGVIHFGKKVEKVLIENGRAIGLLLKDGQEVRADHIISASDLENSLYHLLEGKYIDPMHRELLKNVPVYPTTVQVSFGVNRDLSSEPSCVSASVKMKDTFIIGQEQHQWISHHNYSFDPSMAPEGHSVVICFFRVNDFKYWEKLHADREAYKAEKERIKNMIAGILDEIYPGFKSQIEISDVATPMTYIRYTGNRNGAYMTWMLSGKNANKFRLIRKTVPGLDNFWLAGMWVMAPGGLPTGAKTGRDVIEMICKKDKIVFKTSIPS